MFHDEKLMSHKRIKGLWREANRLADDEEETPTMPSICNTLHNLINREYVNPTGCLSLRTSSMLLSGAAQAYRKKVHSLFADTEQLDTDVRQRNRRNLDSVPDCATDTESTSERSIQNEENSSETIDQEPETMMRINIEPLDFDVSPIISQPKRKSSVVPILYESLKKPRLRRLSLSPRYGFSSSEHLRSTRSESSKSLQPGNPSSDQVTHGTDPQLLQNVPEQNSVPGLPDSPDSLKQFEVIDLESDQEGFTEASEEEQSEDSQTNSSRSQVTPPNTPSSKNMGNIGKQTTPTRETRLSTEHKGQNGTQITPSKEYANPTRKQIGTQVTPSKNYISTQITPSREHVGTQFTPLVEHFGTQTTPSTRQQGTKTGLVLPPDVHLPFAQVFVFAASRVEPCLMIEGPLSELFDSDEDEKW